MNHFSRESGVLLHLTSLPASHGIGDFGQSAFTFIDQLEMMGQKMWQILPKSQPDGYSSPYNAISAFANNPLLISLDSLWESGLIEQSEIARCPDFPQDRVDYNTVQLYKEPLLLKAADRFKTHASYKQKKAFHTFSEKNDYWLDDFTLFITIRELYKGLNWSEWPEKYALRVEAELTQFRLDYHKEIDQIKILQYFFHQQWHQLKSYAIEKGIKIIGDIPIYVSYNSADVWANRPLFKLDEDGRMVVQSGCPPDFFITDGQAWGHPIYDWLVHKKTDYKWWIARLRYLFELVDIIRIDHFNGLAKYWEIPAGQSNGKNGEWIPGPGVPFLKAVYNKLGDQSIIAEDLGAASGDAAVITAKFEIPGMKVLQMAFGEKETPEKIPKNTIVYTGTHDNDTTVGWFNALADNGKKEERQHILDYLNSDGSEINWDLIELALNSNANTVIIPLQDILGLGSEGRMNIPGTVGGNWTWRFTRESLSPQMIQRMLTLTKNSKRKY
ncbi:4-alpha-glucanotransferase [Caldithrix abyssi]|nr:4-alpha-glucanotransferase [Caldithrix abyssi]